MRDDLKEPIRQLHTQIYHLEKALHISKEALLKLEKECQKTHGNKLVGEHCSVCGTFVQGGRD